MDTGIVQEIWNQISNYVSSLDWAYILTFIVIAYGINHSRVTKTLQKATKVKSKTRFRTAIVGLIYGVALFFIRGYELAKVECLFQSFVFAFVFHKLIIDGLVKYIGKKVSPATVAKPMENKEYYDRFDNPPDSNGQV